MINAMPLLKLFLPLALSLAALFSVPNWSYSEENPPVPDITGQATINESSCEAFASGDSCVCIGEVAEVTITILAKEGEPGHPEREFTVSIDGPGSFSEDEEIKEATQTGCPSEATYQIHIDDAANFGDTVTISVDGESVWRIFPAEGILTLFIDQPIAGNPTPVAIGGRPFEEAVGDIDLTDQDGLRQVMANAQVGHAWWRLMACDINELPVSQRKFARRPAGWSPRRRDPRPTPFEPAVPGKLHLPDRTDPDERADVICCIPQGDSKLVISASSTYT
jgi:hypothetical protein